LIVYAWQRIAEDLTTAIESGEFKPGQRLPALHITAERWGVSTTAVGRAYDDLTVSGALCHMPGGPYYVSQAGQTAPAEPAAPAFLTAGEAAAEARLSKMTVYRLINDGTIKTKRVGRNYRIYADSFRAYLNDGR
jgi:excisionase family DNA binding protein